MRRIATALSVFAVATSLALTLGACGGGTDDQAKGGSGEVANLAKTIGDSAVDKSSAHMTFTGDVGGQQVTGDGDITFAAEDTAMQMTMGTPSGDMTIVLTEGVLYLKLPTAQDPAKPWVKVDPSDDNPMAQALGSLTMQLRDNADPRRTLEQFQEAGEITATTSEELNGVQTTHHKITVNVRKLADGQQDAALKEAMAEAIKGGLADFPVDVWIDGENLPVRIALEMPAPDPATGKTTPIKIQVDYTDWGKPVTIAVPPADQLGELPS